MKSDLPEFPLLPIAEVDAMLADHPFGDSAYITEQLLQTYQRRLAGLAEQLPSAALLQAATAKLPFHLRYRTLGDTIMRCAIQHARVQVESGEPYGLPLEQCEELFLAAVSALEQGQVGLLGSGLGERLGPEPHLGWVWDQHCEDTVFKRAFERVLQMNYGDELPCMPTPEELSVLRQAVAILNQLLPRSSNSALSHTHIVAVYPLAGVWASRMSSSEYRIGGTIFLSRRVLANPWTAAEHLYHESLHQQIYDLRTGHQLLDESFARPDAPLTHSPWNRPDADRGNYWDLHRALAAFHVYAHLALLCTAADQHPALQQQYGPVRMVGRRTATVRAHYLREQIAALSWDELGPAGKRLHAWFAQLMELLDPAPPAPGADAHLLLDRYWRETNAIAGLPPARQELAAPRLATLADKECKVAAQILQAMGQDGQALETARQQLAQQAPLAYFNAVRNLIVSRILEAAQPDFRLSRSGVAEGLVRQMVEDSSEVLRLMLERDLPRDSVQTADRGRHPGLKSVLAKVRRGMALSDQELQRLQRHLAGPAAPAPGSTPAPASAGGEANQTQSTRVTQGSEPPGPGVPIAPALGTGFTQQETSLPGHASSAGAERLAQRSGAGIHGLYRGAQQLLVSNIGLGTYRGEADDATDAAYASAVQQSLRAGVNLIDTSLNYRKQRSERSVALGLRRFIEQDGGSRDEAVICSKGGFLVPDAIDMDSFTVADVVGGSHCMAPGFLRDQIARSRRNLGLDTIDVYYLHNPEFQLGFVEPATFIQRIREAFGAMEQAVADGHIQYYGTATWTGYRGAGLSLRQLVDIAHELAGQAHHFRFIELPFSLGAPEAYAAWNADGGSLLTLATELDMTVIASASLWQGKLASDLPEEVLDMMPGLNTDAQRALQFSRSTPGIASALVGMRQPGHVASNLQLAQVPAMGPGPYERLRRALLRAS
ncbi:aldo/keto reductase [Oxalobacteraceae bacterium]|nr:aldo/keto reductase [Oxalobacteraceae bacterium]